MIAVKTLSLILSACFFGLAGFLFGWMLFNAAPTFWEWLTDSGGPVVPAWGFAVIAPLYISWRCFVVGRSTGSPSGVAFIAVLVCVLNIIVMAVTYPLMNQPGIASLESLPGLFWSGVLLVVACILFLFEQFRKPSRTVASR